MLEIRDLRFGYSARAPEILRGIGLTLGDGQIGVLLGKNGAGKTTLFRALLGILSPVRGSAVLDGTALHTLSPRERAKRIAYVPQTPVFGDLPVFDTVLAGRLPYFGLRAGKEDAEKTAQVLAQLGLSSLADRTASRLSGGEKQKVAIARALVGDPSLILFDEPTGNLDPASGLLLLSQIRMLARERGVSVLCSLHGLQEAAALGDRFFFMKDGVIRHEGGDELFTEEVIEEIYGVRVRPVRVENELLFLGGTLQ